MQLPDALMSLDLIMTLPEMRTEHMRRFAVENLMLDNGNVDVIEEMDFSEEKLETARRFQNLLYEMKNLDKRIADIEKENQE